MSLSFGHQSHRNTITIVTHKQIVGAVRHQRRPTSECSSFHVLFVLLPTYRLLDPLSPYILNIHFCGAVCTFWSTCVHCPDRRSLALSHWLKTTVVDHCHFFAIFCKKPLFSAPGLPLVQCRRPWTTTGRDGRFTHLLPLLLLLLLRRCLLSHSPRRQTCARLARPLLVVQLHVHVSRLSTQHRNKQRKKQKKSKTVRRHHVPEHRTPD